MARLVRDNGCSGGNRDTVPKNCRRDASGHVERRHEDRLLSMARSGRNSDGDPDSLHAFIAGTRTSEELGEELAESFLQSATSGEPSGLERFNQTTDAEGGGPYLLTVAEGEESEERSNVDPSPR